MAAHQRNDALACSFVQQQVNNIEYDWTPPIVGVSFNIPLRPSGEQYTRNVRYFDTFSKATSKPVEYFIPVSAHEILCDRQLTSTANRQKFDNFLLVDHQEYYRGNEWNLDNSIFCRKDMTTGNVVQTIALTQCVHIRHRSDALLISPIDTLMNLCKYYAGLSVKEIEVLKHRGPRIGQMLSTQ